MNLNDYFKHQQTYHLSDQKKSELFQHINQKRLEQSVSRRHFSYKKISYTFMATAIVLFTFGGVMLERNGGIDNLFFTSSPTNPANVYADYVAEIIEFNGEYIIQKGNQTLSSSYIHNDDIVYLKDGSEILFTLNDHSQAKIIGPAEFSITKSKTKSYKINLIAGNFFKIFNEIADSDIEIIADDISIYTDKNQPLDIQIAKEGKELLIKNNGGQTKITTTKNNQITETLLAKETISIKNNDINILKDNETFTKFLAKNNISETLSLTNKPQQPLPNDNITTPSGTEEPQITIAVTLPELSQLFDTGNTTTGPINENIKSELGLGEEIKLPTPNQNDALKNNLNSFFLTNNFEKIVKATLKNDDTKFNESLKDLANKINTLTKTFGLENKAIANLSNIKETTLLLKTHLQQSYYIAPSQLTQLEKIANRCDYLSTLSKS
jgi:hypothetical protein